MQKVIKVIDKPPKARQDDDFVDRLSSRYTVMLMIIFAIIIGITQWVGKPMYCWVPKHFTGSHKKYANSFCWVNNTYYLPFHHYIPRPHEHDKRHMIRYYQWIPWILLSQAFFFWLPSQLWHSMNSSAGLDADDLLRSANILQDTKRMDRREQQLNRVGHQLDRFLKNRANQIRGVRSCSARFLSCLTLKCCDRRMSAYLVVLYLFTKVVYLLNIICQLFSLNGILDTQFQHFGTEYIGLYYGNQTDRPGEFINSMTFPRVTMCDFRIRILGNLQRYTVQCTLPLNLYVEKMYMFFYFWMLVLMFLTGTDLIIWFLRAVIQKDRLNFVNNHLNAGEHLTTVVDKPEKFLDDHLHAGKLIASEKQYDIKEFVTKYLKQDGAFLLRMIAHNTNSVTTADITGKLFEIWKEHKDENSQIEVTDDETDSLTDVKQHNKSDIDEYKKPPLPV